MSEHEQWERWRQQGGYDWMREGQQEGAREARAQAREARAAAIEAEAHEDLMLECDCVMRSHPQINLVDVMAHFDIGDEEAHALLKQYRAWLYTRESEAQAQRARLCGSCGGPLQAVTGIYPPVPGDHCPACGLVTWRESEARP